MKLTGIKQTGGLERFNVLKWEMLGLVEKPDSRVVGNLWQTHPVIMLPMSDHLVGGNSEWEESLHRFYDQYSEGGYDRKGQVEACGSTHSCQEVK